MRSRLALGLTAALAACDQPPLPTELSPPAIQPMLAAAEGGTWSTKAPIPTPRAGAAVAGVKGRLYVAGGGTGAGITTVVEAYDPATDSWAARANAPTARGGAIGADLGGKLYVVGGCVVSDCRIGMTGLLEVYDPATDTWATRAPMPTARFLSATGVIGGKLYVAGGIGPCPPCTRLAVLEVYDPATDTWTAKRPLPVTRGAAGGAVVDGRLYVVGGSTGTTAETLVPTVEVYDPATDTWASRRPMPTVRQNLGAAAIGGILYAVGGQSATAVLNTVEAYDPALDTWVAAPPIPTARGPQVDLGVVNDVLYVAGGSPNGEASFTFEAFTPGAARPFTWQQSLIGTGDVWGVATGPGGVVFAATATGVYRSTDNGATWTSVGFSPATFGSAPSTVAVNPANNEVFVGLSNCCPAPPGLPGPFGGGGSGFYSSTDNGATWTYWNVGNPGGFGIAFAPSGAIIAASSGPGGPGGLFVSTDNGASWTYRACCFPRSFANTSDGSVYAGDTYIGLAGPTPGGVLRSTDGGASWTSVGLASTAITAIVATPGDHLFAGSASSGIFGSTDGVTWTLVNGGLANPVTSLAVHSAGEVFAGVFGDGVLSSSDGGQTWTLRNTGLADLRLEALAVSARGFIFAGTPSGVFRAVASTNGPPVASAGGPYAGTEGAAVAFDGSGSSDPDGDALTFSWAFGDGAAGIGATPSHTYADDGTFTATLTVSDGRQSSRADAMVTIANVPPGVGPISAPLDPVAVNVLVSIRASFIDAGTRDTHTATMDWGDGTVAPAAVTETGGAGSVEATHTYAAPGVYTLVLTVADDDGGAGRSIYRYVVVYDPAGGYVTGAGWINSPAGAYSADPSAVGRATFGFVSRYQRAATTPSGNTRFLFQAVNLRFQSDTFQWLVVAAARAQFKGVGTINGAGDYGFFVTAVDGEINGGSGTDKFRIKIWDRATGVAVYDNQMGASDDAAPTTVIGGGNIVIHP